MILVSTSSYAIEMGQSVADPLPGFMFVVDPSMTDIDNTLIASGDTSIVVTLSEKQLPGVGNGEAVVVTECTIVTNSGAVCELTMPRAVEYVLIATSVDAAGRPVTTSVSCVKCHLSAIVMKVMHQLKLHNYAIQHPENNYFGIHLRIYT